MPLPRVALVAAAVVVGLLGSAAPASTTAVARVTVERSVPGTAQPGAVVMTPTLQVAPDRDLTWRVSNTAERTVDVSLDLRSLARAVDGSVLPVGEVADVALETADLTLDAGETAVVVLPRRDVADEVVAGLALVATSPGGAFEDLVGVVVAARAAPGDVAATLVRDDGRLRGSVTLDSSRAVVVDVRARLVTWPSRVVTDRTVRDVVVLPPGRSVELDLAGTAFVGPVDLEVTAGTPDDLASASARAWIVNRTAVRTGGTVVLLITVGMVGTATLRRRRG